MFLEARISIGDWIYINDDYQIDFPWRIDKQCHSLDQVLTLNFIVRTVVSISTISLSSFICTLQCLIIYLKTVFSATLFLSPFCFFNKSEVDPHSLTHSLIYSRNDTGSKTQENVCTYTYFLFVSELQDCFAFFFSNKLTVLKNVSKQRKPWSQRMHFLCLTASAQNVHCSLRENCHIITETSDLMWARFLFHVFHTVISL